MHHINLCNAAQSPVCLLGLPTCENPHVVDVSFASNATVLASQCAGLREQERIGATRLTPRQAIVPTAQVAMAQGHEVFTRRMNLQTLLGIEAKGLRTVQAALRCYGAFAEQVLLKSAAQLPPTLQELVAFSAVFRNSGTFSNYVSALRLACQLADFPTDGMYGTILRRASANIDKQAISRPPKQFLLCQTVSKLSRDARAENRAMEASLYLLAYCFLLRVRSEALPTVLGSMESLNQPLVVPALLVISDSQAVLRLAHRKNRRQESRLVRDCVCVKSRSLCCVHVLRKTTRGIAPGDRVFAGLGSAALQMLRNRLQKIGVANASEFRLHDLRRGHAQDLAIRNHPLSVILAAGDWRSSAFAGYLDTLDLEVNLSANALPRMFMSCGRRVPFWPQPWKPK